MCQSFTLMPLTYGPCLNPCVWSVYSEQRRWSRADPKGILMSRKEEPTKDHQKGGKIRRQE